MSNQPPEFRPSNILDFEQVEITAPAAAPAVAADDKIDRDPLSINFGRDKLHVAAATERMLAGASIDWLIAFPEQARPKALCDKFPHVANRLARGWQDRDASRASVEALAGDARWGTAAFPAQVQGELQRLLNLFS
jgi:hypothetical protein